MKRAFITGITGQDGSYLAEFLLDKGYEVHGTLRRSSSFNTSRIEHLFDEEYPNSCNFYTYYGDLNDSSNINRLIEKIEPDEIYNLGAMSHVKVSFEVPEYTAEVDALGTLRLLDSIKQLRINTKFYQASTSELFGGVLGTEPQSENTPFYPKSPYAVAKLYAFSIVRNYREAYNLFGCNGILFNHESPRRGGTFVTKKITKAVSDIVKGTQDKLFLGNLDAKRDWGYAKDYVEGMWLMLQQQNPNDYVLATGESYSVREFCELAFKNAGIDIYWKGNGIEEKGIDKKTNKAVIEIDPSYFRPTEVDILLGDASKAKRDLGWEPKTKFEDLVKLMVEYDLKDN